MSVRLLAFFFFALIGGAVGVRGQFVWNGQTAQPGSNDATLGSNWVGGVAPSGSGLDNATFGDLTSGPAFSAGDTQQSIDLPALFALRNLTFDGSNRPEYSFNGSGTFTLTGNVTANAGREGGSNVSFGSAIPTASIVLSNAFSSAHTLDVTDIFLYVFSNIGETGGPATLVKNGTGALYLAGNNTFSGGFTINAGTVFLNSSTNPAGTGTLTLNDGATLFPFNHAVILPNAVSLPGGTVTLNSIFDSETGESVDSFTFNGALAGGGLIDLFSSGAVTLAGDNQAWSGGLNIHDNAPVYVTHDNGLGTGKLWFNNDDLRDFPAGSVVFSTAAPMVHGLDGGFTDSGEGYFGSLVQLDSAATALTIDQNFDTVYAGRIEGDGGIVKSGSGTLTLTGPNSYSGNTAINQGTLVASGANGYSSQLGSGAVAINSGGTLAVTDNAMLTNSAIAVNSGGRLTGNGSRLGDGFGSTATTINSGGILAPGLPGAPIGTLTFDDLTLKGGGILEWNLQNPNGSAGAGWDSVSISLNTFSLHVDSSATAGTPFTLKLVSLNGSSLPGTAIGFLNQPYAWTVFDASGSDIVFGSGSFNPAAFSLDSSAFTTDIGPGAFSFTQNGNLLQLNFTPVPEPATWALLIAGLGAVALVSRRRRGRAARVAD